MKFLVTDLRRALTERNFLVALLIGCLGMMIGLLYYLQTEYNPAALEAFMVSQSLILPFIAPLLAALPYSNMNMLESDSGYEKLLLNKSNSKSYIAKRWLTNGIAGGMVFVIPLIIFLLICRVFSGYENITLVKQVIALDFLFGFSYASIAYSLTFVNRKSFLPVVIPQIVYLLFIYAFPHLGLEAFYPPLTFSPWILPGELYIESKIMSLLVITGISILIIIVARIYKAIIKNDIFSRWLGGV